MMSLEDCEGEKHTNFLPDAASRDCMRCFTEVTRRRYTDSVLQIERTALTEDLSPSLRSTRHQCTDYQRGSATSTDTYPALMSAKALRKSSEIIRRSTGIRRWR
ncbi:hypothetical protein Q8A67_008780 [Cirrhinus molitorella]|uniref:Uncharacterized protein n=1 Tax=Cirrhinus molitorella TaxID=172907 RepID=A0AA88TR12_9TELE|nr:hypothetical protein Q8A67_008780 [Cirrhinus molitorella]